MARLTGKVAIVTGSGGAGMGRAAALTFAREGAFVIGCDINEAGAAETVELVRAAGGRMESLQPLDLTLEDNARALCDFAVEKAGGIDILYNNVVSTSLGFAVDMNLEAFTRVVTGNLAPTFLMVRHSFPHMASRGGGSIVNIASIAGTGPGTGLAGNANFVFAYGVGKAGIVRMTEQLAIDLAAYGIRVNCLAPGSIAPVARKFGGRVGTPLNEALLESVLIKRMGEPEDVVNAALYFASDESSYVTGQVLTIDGGWTVSGGLGRPHSDIFEKMRATGAPVPPVPDIYR